MLRRFHKLAQHHLEKMASTPRSSTSFRQAPCYANFRPIWEKMLDFYHKKGQEQYMIGEPITQMEHAQQAFKRMADINRSEAMQVAAAFHDIGHFVYSGKPLDPFTDQHDDCHEELGAKWLASHGFGPEVTEPIRLHVPAKRYLLTTDKKYEKLVSPASIASFKLQGGYMSDDEVAKFRAEKYFADGISLRRCDEYAKEVEPNVTLPTLESMEGTTFRVWKAAQRS